MPPAVQHLKLVDPPPDMLERLYREHHDRVLKAAYRVCGNATDAEDVLQTLFLRLARSGRDLDLSPSPAAYLHRAAVNTALDLVRSRTRSRTIPLDTAPAEALGSGARPLDEGQMDRELKDAIRASLAKLNPRAAEMFALKYFEGYDNREIADMLGISHVVLSVLLHRARARVRADLKKAFGDTL